MSNMTDNNVTDKNMTDFVKNRKFWSPIITLIITLLTWFLPEYFGIEITEETLTIVTSFLWGITSYVVWGDVRYDWKVLDQQETEPMLSEIEKQLGQDAILEAVATRIADASITKVESAIAPAKKNDPT